MFENYIFTLALHYLINASIIFYAIGVLLLCFLIRDWCAQYSVRWYRPLLGKSVSKYDWKDIRYILQKDPLCKVKKTSAVFFYLRNFFTPLTMCHLALFDVLLRISIVVLFVCLLGSLSEMFGGALLENGLLEYKDTGAIALAGALIALCGVLYGHHVTIRAKVASENRQKWVDNVRDTLAHVLNYLNNVDKEVFHSQSDANRYRIKLELLLNPSEKDHRTLSTLLRIGYGIQDLEKTIDQEVLSKLRGVRYLFWRLKQEKRRNKSYKILRQKDHNLLISYIVRLSNAMLKREWEIVKKGR